MDTVLLGGCCSGTCNGEGSWLGGVRGGSWVARVSKYDTNVEVLGLGGRMCAHLLLQEHLFGIVARRGKRVRHVVGMYAVVGIYAV
eukprot:2686354-Amphidinium_carterae.1